MGSISKRAQLNCSLIMIQPRFVEVEKHRRLFKLSEPMWVTVQQGFGFKNPRPKD